MIRKAGELVEYIKAAVAGHGATPHTDVRVRVGTLGPVYRISNLKGVKDQRGVSLLLELDPVPESQE
jgi:hypothetical protein